MKARIIEERCAGCGMCVQVCPQGAIEMVGERKEVEVEKLEERIDMLLERIDNIKSMM